MSPSAPPLDTMPFSHLRNIVAGQASTVVPAAPQADPSLMVSGTEHCPPRSIADDWEEVAASSNSVYSFSSGFDDDAATLAEHDAASSNEDERQQDRRMSISVSAPTTHAAATAVYADSPPDYELIVPSTEGYAACLPRSRNHAQQTDDGRLARNNEIPRPVSNSVVPRQIRQVPSEETLTDRGQSVPEPIPPAIKETDGSAPGDPSFKLRKLAGLGNQNTDSTKSEGHVFALGDHGPAYDSQHDPTTLYNALVAVLKVLDTAAKRFAKHNPDDDTSKALSELEDVVHALHGQSSELEPILRAYSKHWVAHGSGMAAGEMPVDSQLSGWLRSLRLHVTAAQGELVVVDMATSQLRRLDGNALTSETDAMLHTEKLRDLHDTMAMFLPVIKSDFDCFNTRLMRFPILETWHDASSSSRPQPPHPAVARLRGQLYSLKDQIQAHYVLIKGLQGCYPQTRKDDLTRALQLLADVSAAATTILTNNGSEWIQSDLESRESNGQNALPYADFVSLDADVLHDVAGHLKQIHDDLGLASVPLEEICFSSKPLQNHQLHMLTSEGSMEQLISIMEFTQSLLMPSAHH